MHPGRSSRRVIPTPQASSAASASVQSACMHVMHGEGQVTRLLDDARTAPVPAIGAAPPSSPERSRPGNLLMIACVLRPVARVRYHQEVDYGVGSHQPLAR
jgi:hypothetical protein